MAPASGNAGEAGPDDPVSGPWDGADIGSGALDPNVIIERIKARIAERQNR